MQKAHFYLTAYLMLEMLARKLYFENANLN